MVSNSRNGSVVTSELTIVNVSLSQNNTEYLCEPRRDVESFVGLLLVIGENLVCI